MQGLDIELGAEFLHGSATSLIKLAHAQQWQLQELFTWAHGDGGPEPSTTGIGYGLYWLGREKRMLHWKDSNDADFEHLNDTISDMCEIPATESEGDTRSVEQWLVDAGVAPRMMGMAQAGYGNTAAASLDKVSYAGACHLELNWEVDGEGDFRLQKSLRLLIDHLSSSIADCIQLDSCVTSIDYSSSDSNSSTDVITVSCGNGTVLKCSHVIVAVPLSVMQDGDIQFTPALPLYKVKALQHFGMGR
jgi:Flavin containing amine oxidoreductase